MGYRPDELVGKPSFDLIHEEDREAVEAEFPKWIAEKRGWNGLVRRRKHKDGSWRYLESNAVPIEDATGELVGVRVDRDITEQRNAQQTLRESEERYRSLFEDALDMIHIVDANGIIVDANRTELATMGYTREEYIGKPLREVIHPDRRQDTMPSARTVLSGKPVHSHETVLMTKSGEPIDVEVSAAPQVRGGEVVAARAIIRDIRERKRHEEALRLKSSYLQLLKSAAVAANEATSVDDAFRTVIDEVCAFTGWQLGTVVVPTDDAPRRIKGSGIWHADDDPRLEPLRKAVDETGWAKGEGMPGEVFKSGRPLIQDPADSRPHASGRPHAHLVIEAGLNLVALFPVLVGNDVVAVFAFGTSEVDQPDPALLDVMTDIGLQLGRVVERKQIEETTKILVETTLGLFGKAFFESTARQLSKVLGADCALIGQLHKGMEESIRTIATIVDGELADDLEYKLAGTPCENIVGKTVCSYPLGVADLFPEDLLLTQMGVEGYVGVPLYDSNGAALGIMAALFRTPVANPGFAESVTQILASRAGSEIERMRIEDARRASEEKYRQIAERSFDLIYTMDTHGTVTYVSPAAKRLLLQEPDDMIGRHFAEFLAESDLARARRHFAEGT